MTVLLVASIFMGVIVYKALIPEWRQGEKKLFWINLVASGTGYVLIVMSGFDLHTPSLMKPVELLYQMLFG